MNTKPPCMKRDCALFVHVRKVDLHNLSREAAKRNQSLSSYTYSIIFPNAEITLTQARKRKEKIIDDRQEYLFKSRKEGVRQQAKI